MRRLLPLLLLCACAQPAPRPAPRPARPAPTAQERRDAERQYSQAVSAYVDGDYARSREMLKEVLRLDPRHEGARTLSGKLAAVEKASRP